MERRVRVRVGLLMAGFEMAMPIVGLLLGRGLGTAVGSAADYLAVAILVAVGVYMLVEDEKLEEDQVMRLTRGGGLALVALGISISLDELAMGFSIGLLHLPIASAVILIGAQAFLVSQLGLRVGARVGQMGRKVAERLAAVALIGLAILLLTEKLTG
jgi:putative Mn2+ efflux pump MntP